MSNRPIVLHLIDSFGIGGAQQRYFNDLQYLGPEFEHWPCAVFAEGQPVQASMGIRPLRTLGLRRLRDLPIGAAKLIAILWRTPRIRLVHSQLFAADMLARTAAVVCRRPVVTTVQSAIYEPDSGLYSAWRHCSDRATSRCLSRVVAVSDFVGGSAHRRLGVPREKIIVIPNTVDTEAVCHNETRRAATRGALGLGDDTFAWLTVGRLHAAKGLEYLLTAFANVLAAYPSTVLLIAGRGPFLAELQKRVESLRISDRVLLLGERADVLALIDAADAFVFPSLSEGLPVSVLEAMAMEKACVVSRIPPHTEIVEDGVSGVVVAPRDANDLAHGMLALQASPALRTHVGSNARAVVVSRFDARASARRLEYLYADVIGAN